jgi:hypothetical protein
MYRMHILFAVLFVLAIITIWFGVKFEQNKMPTMTLIFLVSAITAGYIHIASIVRSKRMRLFLCLPVHMKSIGELRLLYPLFVWIGLLALSWIVRALFALFTPHLFFPSLANMLYINGLILIIYSLYLIYVDILHIMNNKRQTLIFGVLWFVVFISAMLPFYILVDFAGAFGHNTPLQENLRHSMNSMSVAVSLNVFGYALYRISYYLFPARKTFFD